MSSTSGSFTSKPVHSPASGGKRQQAEPLLTIKEAARILNLPTWEKLGRAVRRGLVQSYCLLNSRRLVRISEVVRVIERTREGGDNDQ